MRRTVNNPIVKFFYLIFTFYLIYYPPILNRNSLFFIAIISYYLIFKNIKWLKGRINLNNILWCYIWLLLLLIYLLFVIEFNHNALSGINFIILWMGIIIPGSIAVTIYFKKNEYNLEEVLEFLINVGLIQSILSLLAFIFPSIQTYFVSKLVNYGVGDIFVQLSKFRIFGFSMNLTYATPVLQTFLAVISIYLAVNYGKKIQYLNAILLLFSSVINARTSIVVFIIGLIFILIFSNFYQKKVLKNYVLIFLIVPILIYLIIVFVQKNSEGFAWIQDGWKEIVLFIQGENTGYFEYVTNQYKYPLPSGVYLFFGKGTRIMFSSSAMIYSDIGYINDIWLGGILYSIIIYVLFLGLTYKSFAKKDSKMTMFLFFFTVFTFFVLNIKGYIFSINDLSTTIWILVVLSIFYNEKEGLK